MQERHHNVNSADKSRLTEDRREVKEAECQWTDQCGTRKSKAVVEVHELEDRADHQPRDEEPALHVAELVLALSRAEVVEGDDEKFHCCFGQDEGHSREDSRGGREREAGEGQGLLLGWTRFGAWARECEGEGGLRGR
jgi:hypothetical protein